MAKKQATIAIVTVMVTVVLGMYLTNIPDTECDYKCNRALMAEGL